MHDFLSSLLFRGIKVIWLDYLTCCLSMLPCKDGLVKVMKELFPVGSRGFQDAESQLFPEWQTHLSEASL